MWMHLRTTTLRTFLFNKLLCCSQAFLHSHNRPQLSLHEEMVRREREREVEERRRQQAEIEASRLKEEERVIHVMCIHCTCMCVGR